MTAGVVGQYGYGVAPNGTAEETLDMFSSLDDAVEYRDQVGGDAAVLVVQPLSESAHWDWGVRSDRGVLVYVSETAARNCVGTVNSLVRRRRGRNPKAWEVVTS